MSTYYAIHGVHPLAAISDIKSAYRSKAMRYHPDRGGTHAEMAKVNEAWEVLSNAELGRQYDQLLASGTSTVGKFEDARRRAKDYPKTWAKFERWFNALGNDFKNAEYGEYDYGFLKLPTATKSLSGWIFIIAGGFLGAATSIAFMIQASLKAGHLKTTLFLFVALASGGAWVGKWLHEKFGSFVSGPEPASKTQASAKPNGKKRCQCPSCGQTLKLPVLERDITVTCPKCKLRFDLPATYS